MSVFGDYAHYYNVLYQDKDYKSEATFILSLLKKYTSTHLSSLLDLGCGTGRHAREIMRQGITTVEGVDMSDTMLEMAQMAQTEGKNPVFHHGDIRKVRLGKKFDAITSLFHVMSYQNTEEDALAMLKTAYEHLNAGGIFLFDFWYGPCVLNLRPEHRIKTMENDAVRIRREATPHLDLCKDMVLVHYDVELFYKLAGERELSSIVHDDESVRKAVVLHEDHPMRYWFLPEMFFLAQLSGFTSLAHGGWMKENPPCDQDWGAWLLLQKNEGK